MVKLSIVAAMALIALASALPPKVGGGGGPTWCTFNDDCLGHSDERITKDCCAHVAGKMAHYDELHNVCVSRFGPLFAHVNLAGMYDCCVGERKAKRMCGCDTQAHLVTTIPRKISKEEMVHYNITDRPSDETQQPPSRINFGNAFMNTIHDIGYVEREGGRRIRVPEVSSKDRPRADYQCEKENNWPHKPVWASDYDINMPVHNK